MSPEKEGGGGGKAGGEGGAAAPKFDSQGRQLFTWNVQRGIDEMEMWPEKLEGYRALLFYLFFFIIFCIILVLQNNPAASYVVNSSLRGLVEGYENVNTQSDWWAYTQTLLSSIFTASWYNGDVYTTDEQGYILAYNKLVGGVLITQTRGTTVDCPASLYTAFYGQCHSPEAATGNFTTSSVSAPTVYPYDPVNGYSIFFSVAQTQSQVAAALAQYQQSLWLDKDTRAMEIKFAVYNGETQLFTFASISFTFGFAGIMAGNNGLDVQSARMELYKDPDDYGRLFLEILFMYMCAWLVSDEAIDFVDTITNEYVGFGPNRRRSISAGLKAYFSAGWNYLDLTTHGLSLAFIALRIGYIVFVYQNPIKLPTNTYQVVLEDIADLNAALLLINVLNIFVKIIHLFKYFAFQPRMNILASTVTTAMPDLFHFFILFGCIFLSYCVMAMLIFGPHLQDYYTFGAVTETLAEMMVGQVNYGELHQIDPIMGTLMMWSYVLIVVFLLVNVFLAILIDAYAEAKAAAEDASGIPQDIARFFQEKFSSKPKGVPTDPLRQALSFFHHKGVAIIDTEDLRWYLRESYGIVDEGFLRANEGILRAMQASTEKGEPNCEMNQLLQAAWSKYDADASGFLDEREFQMFIDDAPIKMQPGQDSRVKQLLKEADKNGDGLISYEEFVPVFHAVLLEGMAMTKKREEEEARIAAANKAKH